MANAPCIARKVVGVVLVVACAGACSNPSGSNNAPSDLSPTAKSRLADYSAKPHAWQAESGICAAPRRLMREARGVSGRARHLRRAVPDQHVSRERDGGGAPPRVLRLPDR